MAKGVIYILTNPSFKEYVKIGYANDLAARLRQLNRSEAVPYAFRAYATYDVDHRLTDKELHGLIDQLNPDLRSIETFAGKKRVKEFFAMEPEEAYSILEAIAKISGTTDRLHRLKPTGEEIEEEKTAEKIEQEARRGPFRFSMIGLKEGDIINFIGDETKTAEVVDDRHIKLGNEVTSLSAATAILYETPGKPYAGPQYWKYGDKTLNELRTERGL